MPRSNTRRCCECALRVPSDTCRLVQTTHTNPTTGNTTTRNNYVCQTCAHYRACECLLCRTNILINNSHPSNPTRSLNVDHLRSSLISHFLPIRPNGLGRSFHLESNTFPNSYSRYSRHICNFCATNVLNVWYCDGCQMPFSNNASINTQPDASITDGNFCEHCAPRHRPCVRCNCTPRNQNSFPANYHIPEAGNICYTCKSTILSSPTFTHNPYTLHAGYEIEFVMPHSGNHLRLHEHGMVKYDGSVQHLDTDPQCPDGWRAWEFCSIPANGDVLYNQLKTVTTAINDSGAIINRTCGVHFHFSMSHFTSKQRDNFIRWWRFFEPLMFDLVRPIRRNNRYCMRGAAGGRYYALNYQHAYEEHGTFEIRLHHATLDFNELWSFLEMLLHMFTVLPLTDPPAEINQFCSKRSVMRIFFHHCRMSLSLKRRIVRRLNTMNSRQYMSHHWRKHPVKRRTPRTTPKQTPVAHHVTNFNPTNGTELHNAYAQYGHELLPPLR
jgi:hypothetical protein